MRFSRSTPPRRHRYGSGSLVSHEFGIEQIDVRKADDVEIAVGGFVPAIGCYAHLCAADIGVLAVLPCEAVGTIGDFGGTVVERGAPLAINILIYKRLPSIEYQTGIDFRRVVF